MIRHARRCARGSRRCGRSFRAWRALRRAPRRSLPRSGKNFGKDRLHMFRNLRHCAPALLSAGLVLAGSLAASGQERARNRIRVVAYAIDAEVLPDTQSLSAKTTVQFIPIDDNTIAPSFELNNALNVSRVVDGQGKQVPASRNQQDFTVRLNFEQPLPKGQPVTVTFYYDGRLSGQEDSPVYGIKFAAIHPDYAFLMYPARWFPVSGYTTDRFAANVRITVPSGYSVLASGLETHTTVGDKTAYEY